MARAAMVETRRDRKELADDAGMGRVSVVSVLCGSLVSFGAFALVGAVVGGILSLVGVDTTTLSDGDWRQVGIGGAAAAGVVLAIAYFVGGYVTGRMARRAGMLNGLVMLVVSLLLAAGAGALVGFGTSNELEQAVEDLGAPTSFQDWETVASIAGAATFAAMLIAAILGGWLGERWHGKLLTRAAAATTPATTAGAVPVERRTEPVGAEDRATEIDLRDDHERHEATIDGTGDDAVVHTHADGNIHAHALADHDGGEHRPGSVA